MNVTTFLRNHPDLALLIDGARQHLVCCHDCGLHFPPAEMYTLDAQGTLGCGACFDWRQDVAWGEWQDRLAKEGKEGT